MLGASSLALVCLAALPSIAQVADPTSAEVLKQAMAAYEAKHYGESARLLSLALPRVEDGDRAGVEYNLACSQALAGDRETAFETLNFAVEDGYDNRKDTESDTDLVSLHADPRWRPLMERMSSLSREQDARWGNGALATAYASQIGDADKLAGLAELWAQAKYGFANFWHVPKLNWDQTYREYISRVLAAGSTADYYRLLQAFYAQLEDGHTGVYAPEELKISPMPLKTRLVDGHLLILGARRAGFDLEGLQPGDEIVTIDGEDAIGWARKHVQPFVSASTAQDRDNRTFGNNLFRAPEGTVFKLGIITSSGTQAMHTFTVPRYVASRGLDFEFRMLPGNIAYVALNEFEDETDAKEWDKHWGEISKAKGIILDLRENGGGSSEIGYHVMASLIDRPTPTELSRSTRWIASYRAWGRAEAPIRFPQGMVEPDRTHHFDGPVVLLTSVRTFSAGEDMAVVFVQAHRGKVIGEATGGSSGQPLMFKLPGGGSARVCTKHDSFADGREFVGVGVQPDVPVHWSRADIVAGRDSVLETAVLSLQDKR